MLQTRVKYIEKEGECYKHGQGRQQKKNATNKLGGVYRKRRRILQKRVGYVEKKKNATNTSRILEKEDECYKEECYKCVGQGNREKKTATNTSRVQRKRRRMLQTCWVGFIEKEEECQKVE